MNIMVMQTHFSFLCGLCWSNNFFQVFHHLWHCHQSLATFFSATAVRPVPKGLVAKNRQKRPRRHGRRVRTNKTVDQNDDIPLRCFFSRGTVDPHGTWVPCFIVALQAKNSVSHGCEKSQRVALGFPSWGYLEPF